MFLATVVNYIHLVSFVFFSNLLRTYIRDTQSFFIYKTPSPHPGCRQWFHYFAFLLMFWAKIAARSAIGTNPSSFLHFVSLAANQFWKSTTIRKGILKNDGREFEIKIKNFSSNASLGLTLCNWKRLNIQLDKCDKN